MKITNVLCLVLAMLALPQPAVAEDPWEGRGGYVRTYCQGDWEISSLLGEMVQALVDGGTKYKELFIDPGKPCIALHAFRLPPLWVVLGPRLTTVLVRGVCYEVRGFALQNDRSQRGISWFKCSDSATEGDDTRI